MHWKEYPTTYAEVLQQVAINTRKEIKMKADEAHALRRSYYRFFQALKATKHEDNQAYDLWQIAQYVRLKITPSSVEGNAPVTLSVETFDLPEMNKRLLA